MRRARAQRRQFHSDIDARREVLQVYWREEEDFATLQEYNDYLELIEDVIADLVDGDAATVARRWAAMEDYKSANLRVQRGAAGHRGAAGGAPAAAGSTISTGARARPRLPLAPMAQPQSPDTWLHWCDSVHAERIAATDPVPKDEAAAAGHRNLTSWRYARALAYAQV